MWILGSFIIFKHKPFLYLFCLNIKKLKFNFCHYFNIRIENWSFLSLFRAFTLINGKKKYIPRSPILVLKKKIFEFLILFYKLCMKWDFDFFFLH